MYAPTIAPRSYAPPPAALGYTAPTGTELFDVLSALARFQQPADLYQGGGSAQALGASPSGFSARPDLMRQVQMMRQGFHQAEPLGQRAARSFGRTEVDAMQAQLLLELFLMALMLGALKAQQQQTPSGAPGTGSDGTGSGGTSSADGNSSAPAASTPSVDAPAGAPGQGVTTAELRRIAPNLTEARANELVPHLNRAMQDAGIKTQRQQAAFIAQLAQESGGFKWFEELASGAAYEGRRDLGNTQPGDGRRYKGRGPIQLTGRANYRAAGKALGLDIEGHPELVATPEVGFKVAAWYWNSRNLNEPAERGDFREVTKRINGGYNGYDARLAYYQRALQVLA